MSRMLALDGLSLKYRKTLLYALRVAMEHEKKAIAGCQREIQAGRFGVADAIRERRLMVQDLQELDEELRA